MDKATVLALCGTEPIATSSNEPCTMGVDTGRVIHVVISRPIPGDKRRQVVHIGVHKDFSELDALMEAFSVRVCVIDALPETHPTRAFAERHPGVVFRNYFSETQKGAAKWDVRAGTVQENRTEILDASRRAIRDRKVVLPRQTPLVETFAVHMAAVAKKLEEDADSGAQRYVYVRSGADHCSMAFTYDVIAREWDAYASAPLFEIVGETRSGGGGVWFPMPGFSERFF